MARVAAGFAFFLAAVLLFPACARLPWGAEARLQDSLEEALDFVRAPGAVLLVRWPDGRTWAGTAGFSRIEVQKDPPVSGDLFSDIDGIPMIDGAPMRPELKFQAASMVKSMIATVAMQMESEGLLSLNDRLGHWLPGIVPGAGGITLRQLLDHTSGLYNYTDVPAFTRDLVQDPRRKRTPQELMAHAAAHRPYARPGHAFAYSNTNYILMGLVLEKASGRTIGRLLEDRIFKPLGLDETTFPTTSQMPPGHSRGYRYEFFENGRWGDVTEFADPGWTWAAGSLVTDVFDLADWFDALLSGRLLGPEEAGEVRTFVFTGASSIGYALGLRRWGETVGMTGDHLFGYQCGAYRYRGVDFIVLVNGNPARLGEMDGPGVIFRRAARDLFDDFPR